MLSRIVKNSLSILSAISQGSFISLLALSLKSLALSFLIHFIILRAYFNTSSKPRSTKYFVLLYLIYLKTNLYLLSALNRAEEERDGNYRVREITTHLLGEIAGELVGEEVDEVVESLVGRVLSVELEEETDPLRAVGKGIGKALG